MATTNVSQTLRFRQPGMRSAHNKSKTPATTTAPILNMLMFDESVSVPQDGASKKTAAAIPTTNAGNRRRKMLIGRPGEVSLDMRASWCAAREL